MIVLNITVIDELTNNGGYRPLLLIVNNLGVALGIICHEAATHNPDLMVCGFIRSRVFLKNKSRVI